MRRTRATALPKRLEKHEQRDIIQLLRAIGAAVYVIGHPSPNDGRAYWGTGQTPGIPDLYVVLPARGIRRHLWVEVKRKGGRVRDEQREFATHCGELSGPFHVMGTYDDVLRWLEQMGYVNRGQVNHERLSEAS